MEDKVILITGASSGIGRETAIKAKSLGARLILVSRSIESTPSIQHLLDEKTLCKNVDVSNEDSVKELFLFIEEKFSKLDVIVNCAGYVEPESLLDTTIENWENTISINLTGTFLICKFGTLLMKNVGGKIINISSTAGLTPRPGWSAYAAAKSGVINFSSAIAEELKNYGIKVYTICPGRTATPLRKILAPHEDPKSIMQPGTVADFILFCMTETSNVIEGQPLLVRERF